jgi:hypothetical protein
MRIGLDRGKCQWRSKMRTLWAMRVPSGIEVEPDIGISARSRNRPWLGEREAAEHMPHVALERPLPFCYLKFGAA